MLLTLFLHV